MKEITETKTRYQCKICGQLYDTKADAIECEKVPITKKKKVKIGDIVAVYNNNSCVNGAFVKIKEIKIVSKDIALALGVSVKDYLHTHCIKAIYSKGLNGGDDKIVTLLYNEFIVSN